MKQEVSEESLREASTLRGVLREFIEGVEFNDNPETEKHKYIYSYIDQKIVSPTSPCKDQCPPLDVVIYASRNILYPQFLPDQIPDLLDLLSTVEFYRKRAISAAEKALVFNSYYKKIPDNTITLTPDEETIINAQVSNNNSMRHVYIFLLRGLCMIDIHHLWTRHPPSMASLAVHMNEYFPRLNKYYLQKSPRLFHFDLSDSENKAIDETGLSNVEFIKAARNWALERRGKGQTLASVCQSKEFAKAFQLQDPSRTEVLELLEYYLTQVQTEIRKFEEIFDANY